MKTLDSQIGWSIASSREMPALPSKNAKVLARGADGTIENPLQTKSKKDSVAADKEFTAALVSHIPSLRAYSISLCRKGERADDLVQEALCRAWKARESFRPGSNLIGWLKTILHNQFCTDCRVASRERSYGQHDAPGIATPDDPMSSILLADTVRALRGLSAKQREAVILIGVGGLGYGEAAVLGGCPPGTIKSRVGRARKTMLAALDGVYPVGARSGQAVGSAMQELLVGLNRLTTRRVT